MGERWLCPTLKSGAVQGGAGGAESLPHHHPPPLGGGAVGQVLGKDFKVGQISSKEARGARNGTGAISHPSRARHPAIGTSASRTILQANRTAPDLLSAGFTGLQGRTACCQRALANIWLTLGRDSDG